MEVSRRERDARYHVHDLHAINFHDFDRAAVRRTVHQMHEQNENATLDKLLAKVRASGEFPDGQQP